MTNLMTAQERREAFSDMGFQYGDDFHYWDYAQWIADMLTNTLEHIEGLVGADTAAGPLRQLVQDVAHQGGYTSAVTWRDVVDDVLTAGTIWPISKRLNNALMYGLFGVTPEDVSAADRADWLADLVKEVRDFANRSDVRALTDDRNPIILIANLAASRFALDTGNGEVDVHSLSVLGSVSEGRIRNLLSGVDGGLERGPEGGIVALSALTWLQKRKDFMQSIWDAEEQDAPTEEEPSEPIDMERAIFVPVARDGSIFNPGLLRGGLYQIGAKGEEQHFTSFVEALVALNGMPVPRWRRPNEKGHWGIVSGVAWQRVERQQ